MSGFATTVRSLACPNCGGVVELRGFKHTLSAVCIQCLSVIDASTPEFKIVQQFRDADRVQPLIPLGSRGKFEGKLYEAVGFQVRQIEVDGTAYAWREYVLFNPYAGFRYLSEYNNHWNWIRPTNALPQVRKGFTESRPTLYYNGRKFGHFQNSHARTVFVMGEFPWKVQADEVVMVDDFVDPPLLASRETTGNEVTFSIGEYLAPEAVQQGFGLKAALPTPVGVFANQPSPYASAGPMWMTCLLLCGVWAVLFMGSALLGGGKKVFEKSYRYEASTGDAPFVTNEFQLDGGNSTVGIRTRTDLVNDWVYLNLSLINSETGRAWDFGREISNYSDEGSPDDHVTIPGVPAGKYYLRIDPEMDDNAATLQRHALTYRISVDRGEPVYWWLWLALPLLPLPALWRTLQRAGFETKRWAESDYAPQTGSDE
jgi:hypothetical protein